MKNEHQHSRRNFLTTALKGAVMIGGSVTLLSPLTSLAQASSNAPADLRAKVAELGTASLETSKLALLKAANPQVKMFAKFEAAEQETMGRILKDMGTPTPAPSAKSKTIFAKLQGVSGAAFDKAFMQAQVDTHKKLHQAVSALMNAGSDAHTKHVTSLALATITEHTERGQMLLSQLV